ncbi:MAG TPA: tetratricopeptide repeat protein [Verrucomicrobiae bacterium]|nr:tetratricopeptide repeat protein [Verrucomicrobiae bacterium]
MTRALCTLTCVSVMLAGCVAPDLGRGKAALEAGDTETAERDLAPLAELGYEDAKLALARVYARRTDPESQKQAIALYTELLKEDPAVAVPLARMLMADGGNAQTLAQAEKILDKAHKGGDPRAAIALLELYSDHPQRDTRQRSATLAAQVGKQRTPEAEVAVIKWYRRNALTDTKFAAELIKRCENAKDRLPECYVDLARHYRASGNDKEVRELAKNAQGRFSVGVLPSPVLEKLAWSLVSEDIPGTAYPDLAQPMLKTAAETSDVARVRLARLLIENPHLDPEGKPELLLLKAAERGSAEASLVLGRMYLDGKLAAADPVKALKYLEQAAAAEPAAHYHLGRIYKRGYLGKSDPVLAARYYLTAARSGYARADQALAQLFSDNRGVRPNLANAYVFASIAAEAKTPEGALMLKQIRALMKPGDLQEAERLLKQELAVRNAQMPVTASTGEPTPTASVSLKSAQSMEYTQ